MTRKFSMITACLMLLVMVGSAFAQTEILLSFGQEGDSDGEFTDIRSVAIDSLEQIIVADYQTGMVSKFDAEGKFMSNFTVEGDAPITDLEVGKDDMNYVVRGGNIYITSPDGKPESVIEKVFPDYQFDRIELLNDGSIVALYAFGFEDQIFHLDSEGEMLSDPIMLTELLGGADLGFVNLGFAVDNEGNFFIAEGMLGTIFEISAEGELVEEYQITTDFPLWNGLEVDTNGNLLLGQNGKIEVISREDGKIMASIALPEVGIVHGITLNAEMKQLIVTQPTQVHVIQLGAE